MNLQLLFYSGSPGFFHFHAAVSTAIWTASHDNVSFETTSDLLNRPHLPSEGDFTTLARYLPESLSVIPLLMATVTVKVMRDLGLQKFGKGTLRQTS